METDTLGVLRKPKSVRFFGLSPANSPDDTSKQMAMSLGNREVDSCVTLVCIKM